jgi:hypothetical protein
VFVASSRVVRLCDLLINKLSDPNLKVSP